jgi:hypothetical protein
MPKVSIRFWILAILLAGCAHRGAVRVECEGALRPINRPAPLKDAPVTVVPGSPEATQKAGTAP